MVVTKVMFQNRILAPGEALPEAIDQSMSTVAKASPNL